MPLRIEDIIDKVKKYNQGSDSDLLKKAYLFSAYAHEGQLRRSGEPYLVHPIEVMNILADFKADDVALVSGLLHDVIEDNYSISLNDVENKFGKDVAHIVGGVTKISQLQDSSREKMEIANLRKLIVATLDDLRVIIVKLADRLHNMRTLEFLPPDKQKIKAMETLEIYAPIAYRLGMGILKTELEELGFQYSYKREYEEIAKAISEKRVYASNFIEKKKEEIENLLTEAGIKGFEVQGRIKHLYSIYQKMKMQDISVEQVYDYVAFRIITNSIMDCYGALGIVHTRWKPIPGRFKDWINMPKENHYSSIHTSVIADNGQPFEVQMRTKEMHKEAENGLSAHWRYKDKSHGRDDEEPVSVWLQYLKEWRDEAIGDSDFMKGVQMDLAPKEMYIFTPKGKPVLLSFSATCIDFAYAVHTEVGNKCIGARVGGKMTPLKTQLKSGDIVEVITSQHGKPSRDWLSFAKTSRAIGKIKAFLNKEERDKNTEMGRLMLEQEGHHYKISLKRILSHQNLEVILKKSGFVDIEALLVALGSNKLRAKTFLANLLKNTEQEETTQSKTESPKESDGSVVVLGSKDMLYSLAKCCKPIYGENVVGFISRGKGLIIHRASCSNVSKYAINPERMMPVEWDIKSKSNIIHPVKLEIYTEDRVGMMADVTGKVKELNTNLLDSRGKGMGSEGYIQIIVGVTDINHLNKLILAINNIKGVFKVVRSRSGRIT